MDFAQKAQEAGTAFLETPKEASITIISHFDTDGLSACAIIESALDREGYIYSVKQVPHLDDDALVGLDSEIVFFLDIGANKISEISSAVKGKAYVLDHHQGSEQADNVVHINPHAEGESEPNIISGSGVAYFFALGMNASNRQLAHIGVLGAIGDSQERNGFIEYNAMMLQHAIVQKSITVGKRLRLYGINSRPLLKVLEYSTDVDIPGVTNNPQGAKQFLRDLNIFYSFKARNGERPRLKKYFHLRPDEKERLTEKILELKDGDESLLANSYTFTEEHKRELQDAREYATVINACGRLGDYNTAIECLKGHDDAQDRAVSNMFEYKKLLRSALDYVHEHRESFLQGEGYIIIDLDDKVKPSMVGIVASILARNKKFDPGIIVCTLGQENKYNTKISLRVSRDVMDKKLQDLLSGIVGEFGANAGGHDNAAGAVIKTTDKEKFIESLKNVLENNK